MIYGVGIKLEKEVLSLFEDVIVTRLNSYRFYVW